MNKSSQQMIRESRIACESVAEGEFTPVVFKWFQNAFNANDCGWQLAYASQTVNGRGCIVWL